MKRSDEMRAVRTSLALERRRPRENSLTQSGWRTWSRLRGPPRVASLPVDQNQRGSVMPNPGQPTVGPGATGPVVRRVQRALRRTPNLGLVVDGIFGPATEAAVIGFQQGAGLVPDGIVGPLTWNALPDGGPMPTLEVGSSGPVVSSLQRVLTNGAPGQWTAPGPIDGTFGPLTRTSVESFQVWGVSPRTASSATRHGPSRCMRPAPPSRPRSAWSS